MRVLLITPTFPPVSGSHVQRMLKMANCLADEDVDITVLSAKIDKNHPTFSFDLVSEINSKIKIIRAPQGFLHRKAYSTFKDESDIHYNKKKTNSSGIKRIIYNFVQKSKRTILFPDTMVDWVPAVLKFERKNNIVSRLKPDIIVSCSQPSSTHILGYRLSKMYGIPLYMDYADPWTYLDNYNKKSIRFILNRLIENRIICYASGLSFSAPGCMNLYRNKFSLQNSKTVTAMSGIEERLLFKSQEKNTYARNNKITFTYGGALHEYVRNPSPFFSAAKDYEDQLEVDIRTDNIDFAKRLLMEANNPKCINILPYISFDEYFDEMLTKDVILFFGNKNNIQVPGKIFNCLATGRFILYIKSNDSRKDTVEEILRNYKKSIVVSNTASEISRALKYIIENMDVVRANWTLDKKLLQYSDREQYKRVAIHLKKIIRSKEK